MEKISRHVSFSTLFRIFFIVNYFQKANLFSQEPTFLYFVKKAKQSTSDFFDSRKMTFTLETMEFPERYGRLTLLIRLCKYFFTF